MLAVFAAARARMAAATASARKFGLPLLSSTRASNTTSSALAAISSGTSIVFMRAASTSWLERIASTNAR